jgi:hypothetical protein
MDAALGLVAALPATSSVVIVAAGGQPRVLSPLSADRGSAAKALTNVAPLPGHRISDAVLFALRQLQPSPGRYRHLVVIATGRDSSTASIDEMRSALTSYQPSVQVLDVGQRATYPDAGEQCPITVSAGHGSEAGQDVAARIRSEERVLLLTVGDPTETTVRVRTSNPAVDTGAQIEPATMQLIPDKAPPTRLRAWLAGTTGRVALGALACLFVALLVLNSRPVRRTLHSWRVKAARGPKEKAPMEGVLRLSLTEALDRVTGDQMRADQGGSPRVRAARDSIPASVGGKGNEPQAKDVEGAPAEAPVAEPSALASEPGPPEAGPPGPSNDSGDEEAPVGIGEPAAASQTPLLAPSATDRAAHARRLAAMRVAAQRAAERAAPAEAASPPEATDLRDVRDVRGGRVVTRPPGSSSN